MWSVGLNQVSLKIDSDRKDTLFFRDVQEKSFFRAIFCLEDRQLFQESSQLFLGNESTFSGGNIPILHTIGGRAYPVRHYPIAIRLRTREEYAILCIALNPQSGDFSGAILEVPFKALLHGRIRQCIREVKETAILRKSLFCVLY